MLKFKTKT